MTSPPDPPDKRIVTQALNQASAGDAAPAAPRRRFLWTVYYVCWAAALLAPVTAAVLVLFERLGLSLDTDAAFLIGPPLGATVGITLGHWMRRPRWPHVGPIALGAPVACAGLAMICMAQAGPRPFLWELWLFFYGMIAVNGVALCCAGAAGLRLNSACGPTAPPAAA